MNRVPRLSIGLPVYNGEEFLSESLDTLLGQSYEDFELIISDNDSADGTADICRHYAMLDSRIRYVRQPRNIGLAGNHNFVASQARGELFKWASDDDLYARDLVKMCVEALDEYPGVVLAHSWTATVDNSGAVTNYEKYSLNTASPYAPERFRSTLFDYGGDDDYGVMRTAILRQVAPLNSYYHADRTNIPEVCLRGPFYQVPDWLYFRRDHPGRPTRAMPRTRDWCANYDPRRANRLRHPIARLYIEFVWGFLSAIRRAPLSPADRRECYRHLALWMADRALPATRRRRSASAGQATSSAEYCEPASIDHGAADRSKEGSG